MQLNPHTSLCLSISTLFPDASPSVDLRSRTPILQTYSSMQSLSSKDASFSSPINFPATTLSSGQPPTSQIYFRNISGSKNSLIVKSNVQLKSLQLYGR